MFDMLSVQETRRPAGLVELMPTNETGLHALRNTGPPTRIAAIVLPLVLLAVAINSASAQNNATAPSGLREVNITDRGTVQMHVSDLPLSTVLHMLSVEGRRNIIASPKVRGSVTANLYDVTFEQALEAILVSNGSGYRVLNDFIYVYTNEELVAMDAAAAPPFATRVYRLSYISPADAERFLSPLVGEDGTITIPAEPASGLGSDPEEAGGNAYAGDDVVLVTARLDRLSEIERILKELDVRPKQVLIEATILRAQLSEDNALGIDFSLLGGVDLAFLGASSNGIADITLGELPAERFDNLSTAVTTDLTGNVPGGGLTVGVIKNNVAAFLRALEEVTDTTVLANPKLLVMNRQKAQVIVGRRDGFFTTTVTQTQSIQSVKFLETGTQLIVRPFIGHDGFIRVELHPEDSVGFVNAQGLPSEQTTELTTNVIVRDGETILLGGLFREVTVDTRSQVPGIGSIPGLGVLFRSSANSTTREEVIILLTIHIIKNHEAFVEASRELGEDIERLRVGSRKGLMGHGRERIASAHYEKAVEAINRGRQRTAMWHLNLAVYTRPTFVAARRLREQILSEREWDVASIGGRAFLHSLITREKGYELPMFGRPAIETSKP